MMKPVLNSLIDKNPDETEILYKIKGEKVR